MPLPSNIKNELNNLAKNLAQKLAPKLTKPKKVKENLNSMREKVDKLFEDFDNNDNGSDTITRNNSMASSVIVRALSLVAQEEKSKKKLKAAVQAIYRHKDLQYCEGALEAIKNRGQKTKYGEDRKDLDQISALKEVLTQIENEPSSDA